ncbi:GNAT family N-acetyltransferase [Sphingomonas sp. ac-8]|uniref:GNAT family N-acetyltransferase n=1 Tax=Sphingomonas sp. ac-8 TaxID=3242977 RepID=UPI003A805534
MIAIRAATPRDAEAIAAIYAGYVTGSTISFEEQSPDADAIAERMAAQDGFYPWLVATGTDPLGETGPGEILGYAYAGPFRERQAYRFSVETTIYLAGNAHGQGVGRLLYEALIVTLRAQGFTQAMGVIALPNGPSISLHEAVGFRRAGVIRSIGYKQGQWIDIGLWQCELAHTAMPPAEPRSFRDVGVVRA